MLFSTITGTIGAAMIIMCLALNVHASEPKYITQCKLYGQQGNAIECTLVPNPMHVTPDTKWSAYRMKREGLPPVKTATKTIPMVCPCHKGKMLEDVLAKEKGIK